MKSSCTLTYNKVIQYIMLVDFSSCIKGGSKRFSYLVSVVDVGIGQRSWHKLIQHNAESIDIWLEAVWILVLQPDNLWCLKKEQVTLQYLTLILFNLSLNILFLFKSWFFTLNNIKKNLTMVKWKRKSEGLVTDYW